MPHDTMETTGRGLRALLVSLVGLLLTTAFQAVIALLGGSAGLLAETIHNLADAFAALPLGLAFILARREANRRFTYGYGRAEDAAGAVVVLLILASAGFSAHESYQKLAQHVLLHEGVPLQGPLLGQEPAMSTATNATTKHPPQHSTTSPHDLTWDFEQQFDGLIQKVSSFLNL